jgi:MFS family permease
VIQARRGAAAEPRLRRAALATALVFAVSGFVAASWVSRLPATRDRLGASAAELGLVLLAPGVGSLLSMPFSGRWCRRFGSRLVVAATTTAACAVLVALAVVPNLIMLGLGLFVWGTFYGSWDVAMNVHGSAVEQRAGREWMPRYHACWSVGGIAGAGCGALAASAGLPLVARPFEKADVGVKVTCPPAELAAVLTDLLDGPLGWVGPVSAHAGTGVLWMASDAREGELEASGGRVVPALAEGIAAARERLAACEGSLVLVKAPPELKRAADAWGPAGDALGLMRRVKERFDPDRRLSPGRFVGGI